MISIKVFNPEKSIFVPASKPHPQNTEYKVSLGTENWNDSSNQVIKVQMVYDGRVSGRRSPSYPSESDDYERVKQAVEILEGKCRIKLSKDIYQDNKLLEAIEKLFIKNSEFLEGYTKETTNFCYFLILNFNLHRIDETITKKIIEQFLLLFKQYHIEGTTDFINKFFYFIGNL